MEQNEQVSKNTKLLILFSFSAICIVACVFFLKGTYNLYQQVSQQNSLIEFNKTTFYLLGAGIALASVTVAMYLEGWKGISLTATHKRNIVRSAIFGIVLLVIVPHAVHFGLEALMENKGYVTCEEKETKGFRSRTIFYAADSEGCF